MLRIRYNINYRHVDLREVPGGHAPVVRKSGEIGYEKWLGFLDVEIAKQIETARPVKLNIAKYSYGPEVHRQWTDIPKDKAIQGCLTNVGVYAVLHDGRFRIVPRPGERWGT